MVLLGRYIGKTNYVEILKHYDDKKEYNKEALASYIKRLMVFTGSATVLLSLLSFSLSWIVSDVDVAYLFLILYALLTIRYIIVLRFACKKFEKRSN
jgi:phosphotransferase system  glucose/maltose/N-acetylglucosamine-specific IIC component